MRQAITMCLVSLMAFGASGAACSNQTLAARSAPTLLPSELAASPDKYDGKHVDVRGYVVVGPESRNIFDSEQGSRDRHGVCLGLDGPNTMFSEFHKRPTPRISGIFHRKLCGEKDVCLYWCGEAGIALDKGSKP